MALRLPTSERDFQRTVLDLARLRGWKIHHDRPARQGSGWVTAISGDPGFPDLVLARRGRVVMAELKVGANRPSPAQRAWAAELAGSAVETYLWYPGDWEQIVKILT